MKTLSHKLPFESDSWGRIIGLRPVSYMVDWSRSLPTKQEALHLAGNTVEPYRLHVTSRNVETHYDRMLPKGFKDDHRSLELLRDSHKGETLVLVGAGPSAAGIGERLAPYRDKCKVMACNKALNFVPDADYFYLIEALPKDDWWLDTDPSKTKLICPIHAGETLAAWPRKSTHYCWIKDARHIDEEIERLPLVCGSHHVGTSALHVAHILGFSRVLLVGFDFCATDVQRNEEKRELSGTFYGDGTTTRESYINGHEVWLVVDSIGNEVMVTQHLMDHANAMRVSCEIALDAGMNLVNCAGCGTLDFGSVGHLETLLED